ncbi:hypothetical protein BDN70DRAFT_888117 [Pholiota conissans]|uniref:Uncharacterized protein n=1 Tax=Pholiota conissans TaxID=109636 RepID=A0A9P6CM84_9AGAR|nr:hypothetical protein BDN70DRAFT_888117 [Pholiota conissans]
MGDEDYTDEDDNPFFPKSHIQSRPVNDNDAQVVIVNFRVKNAPNIAAEEVLVEASPDLVSIEDVDGQRVFKTSLARLIPKAIENFSPKKDSSTRIHRPGLDDPQNTVNLGSIGAFLSGVKPRNLNFPLVDEYKLRIEDKGLLVCDLLLDDVDSSNDSSSSVKPLDLARLRKDLKVGLKSPRKKSAFIDKGSEFIKFLRTFLDVQPRAPRAETVGHLLECYLALEAGYSKLTNMQWGRTKGGYRVPSGMFSWDKLYTCL